MKNTKNFPFWEEIDHHAIVICNKIIERGEGDLKARREAINEEYEIAKKEVPEEIQTAFPRSWFATWYAQNHEIPYTSLL